MSTLERRLARALVVITSAMIASGCREPIKSTRPETPVDAPLAARLEPADPSAPVGAIVRVALTVRGTSANDVASFTARIAYDPTKLRYVDEVAIEDKATRVINPQYGLLRVAGIAPAGFSDGKLLLVRFTVLQQGALSSLRLTVDEMHTAANADVRASLRASDR
jgi:hypothetical protein